MYPGDGCIRPGNLTGLALNIIRLFCPPDQDHAFPISIGELPDLDQNNNRCPLKIQHTGNAGGAASGILAKFNMTVAVARHRRLQR